MIIKLLLEISVIVSISAMAGPVIVEAKEAPEVEELDATLDFFSGDAWEVFDHLKGLF